VADLNLGTRDARVEHLLDLLRNVQTSHLYLVGDVFDPCKQKRGWFWPG